MKTLHLGIIFGVIGIIALGNSQILAENSSIIVTPFDISFLENDFNKTGISHQILILKPNKTADIHVIVTNNDVITHQVHLQVPTENLRYFVSSYSLESSTLTIGPHLSNQTILHIKTENINDTQTGLVFILAQDKSFGIKSKGFYLAVSNDITDQDLALRIQSLREAMPGPAFPNLHAFNAQENTTIAPGNIFGMPTYLPNGYRLQGISEQAPGPLLVYSPVQVTDNTTGTSFLHSGGMTIYYEINKPTFDLNNWLPAYIGQNEAQEISINGAIGTAIEQQKMQVDGIPFNSSSEIVLFKDTSQIQIQGNVPLGDLLKVASSISISKVNRAVLASCAEDKDWPQKPCNDVINTGDPNQKPILGDKKDWQAFYNMKGKDWMESKKQEMYFADQNKILKEWYEYGGHSGHFANSDVWYYYSLYGQSPDIVKYYNGIIQKDWLQPIITYYYVSPIVFVIIGIAAIVVGFFISKKILVRIKK